MESFGMVLSRANTQCHCHMYFRYIATAIEALMGHRGFTTHNESSRTDSEPWVAYTNLLRRWSHLGWFWAGFVDVVGSKKCGIGSFCKIVQRKEAFKMKQDQRFRRKKWIKLKERNCRRLKLEAIISWNSSRWWSVDDDDDWLWLFLIASR